MFVSNIGLSSNVALKSLTLAQKFLITTLNDSFLEFAVKVCLVECMYLISWNQPSPDLM